MRQILRGTIFILLFMANLTGTKSSLLKTHLKLNTRALLPWQQIEDAFASDSRQELKMMLSCREGQQLRRCQENPKASLIFKDKEVRGLESAKRSPVAGQQSTNPPKGWWIYVNGHRRGKKLFPADQRPRLSTPTTKENNSHNIIEDFFEFLKLKNRGVLNSCLEK